MLEEKSLEELFDKWVTLNDQDKLETFYSLERDDEDEVFLRLSPADQKLILELSTPAQTRNWLRLLEPDDLVDLLQLYSESRCSELLPLLDTQTQKEARALMAYRDDVAGGLMNTRFARLRPEMSVDEALKYLRAQTIASVETIYYAYILAPDQTLLGTVSLRQLFKSSPQLIVQDIMTKGEDLVTVEEGSGEEDVANLFSQWTYLALPVVSPDGKMKGILTVDDVVEVVQDVATEDIQKMGGQEALDAPYFQIGFLTMIKKRAGWLMVLFIGEMFTATAMGYYEMELERAVVLAFFIPLIISSGGNSGSQASTLIIRAMALGEVRLVDWWRVMLRELSSGLTLGLILGILGLAKIALAPNSLANYGEHYIRLGFVVGFSLVGIVLWGTLTGAMLPFLLRKMKFDPATASAPFVATLVDVTGLIIYFTFASLFLKGTLL